GGDVHLRRRRKQRAEQGQLRRPERPLSLAREDALREGEGGGEGVARRERRDGAELGCELLRRERLVAERKMKGRADRRVVAWSRLARVFAKGGRGAQVLGLDAGQDLGELTAQRRDERDGGDA